MPAKVEIPTRCQAYAPASLRFRCGENGVLFGGVGRRGWTSAVPRRKVLSDPPFEIGDAVPVKVAGPRREIYCLKVWS